jgi:hypothetical protein
LRNLDRLDGPAALAGDGRHPARIRHEIEADQHDAGREVRHVDHLDDVGLSWHTQRLAPGRQRREDSEGSS